MQYQIAAGGGKRPRAPMQLSPKCEERQILYGRLRADTKVYSEVTRRLDSCKPEDFEATYQAAELARRAFATGNSFHFKN